MVEAGRKRHDGMVTMVLGVLRFQEWWQFTRWKNGVKEPFFDDMHGMYWTLTGLVFLDLDFVEKSVSTYYSPFMMGC